MKTVTEHIREGIYLRSGILKPERMPPPEELRRTEWSPTFEKLMRNRLVMGAFRYGRMGRPEKRKAHAEAAIRHLEKYLKDRNPEHLPDAANLCLMEFVENKDRQGTFRAGDDTEHVKER